MLKQGTPFHGAVVTEIIKDMKRGDVFIKGANAVDCRRLTAGIYLGHDTGGTIGAALGTIAARGIRLVIPVGLEKLVGSSIEDLSVEMQSAMYGDDQHVGYIAVHGEIITEIEALDILFGVTAEHMGSGGVGGAEGSVHLLISGDKDKVSKAMWYVRQIQGERVFAELRVGS